MKTGSDTLTLIQASFPGRDRLVERVFRERGSFRDLCEDYRRCAAALHRWQSTANAEAAPRWQEYRDLLMELGREIEVRLDAAETATSGSTGSSA